jgi:Fe-S-cluster-containing dehydrogenase component
VKLLIDLEAVRKLAPEAVACSYSDHPDNRGVQDLVEKATFSVICRHCELATCVQSCPQDALEKQTNDVVTRYVLRCSNCYSCAAACPFGTIIPEYIPLHTSVCDVCLGRLPPGEVPLCARSAPEEAIQYGDFSADEATGIYPFGEHVLVKAGKWEKDKV